MEWAGSGLDAPTFLIYMALFERSLDLKLDVEVATWRPVRHGHSTTNQVASRMSHGSHPSMRRYASWRPASGIPTPLSQGEFTKIAMGQQHWLWQ